MQKLKKKKPSSLYFVNLTCPTSFHSYIYDTGVNKSNGPASRAKQHQWIKWNSAEKLENDKPVKRTKHVSLEFEWVFFLNCIFPFLFNSCGKTVQSNSLTFLQHSSFESAAQTNRQQAKRFNSCKRNSP